MFEALQHEIQGESSARKGLLASAAVRTPQYAPAWWHNGFVREQTQWLKYSEVSQRAASDARLATYQRARAEYPDTVEGQLALARWCAEKQLTDQRRAHLARVLELDPENAEAHYGLGDRRVHGVWQSPDAWRKAETESQRAMKAMREWGPHLAKIGEQLATSSGSLRKKASRQLSAITDPAAVGPMERLLAGQSEETALLVVGVLKRIDGHEASLALAREAVVSPWNTVREAAAGALGTRSMDHYVPALLASMSTKISSRIQLETTAEGQLLLREEFYREEQDRGQRKVLETTYRSQRGTGGLRAVDESHAIRDAAQKVEARQTQVEQQNQFIEQVNERITKALAIATGVKQPADPNRWWEWWNETNEVYVADQTKPVDLDYQNEEVSFARPAASGSGTMDCLAAGTLVWTELGPRPIEQIVLGDRVLSQNVESGELAYKPVLRTTLRPPSQLVCVWMDREQIRASGGHPVWVSGKGWCKVRDLETNWVLHGVTDPASVVSTERGGSEPTYNLVVADFHTYFVGRAKVLTHDNTVRQPTDAIVPGLRKADCVKYSLGARRASTAGR